MSPPPDVPTIAEAGVPGYDVSVWFGLVAPRGTRAAIVDKTSASNSELSLMETIFPMLEVMQIPPKPRTNSMLLMSEIGISLRQSEDICEGAASVIDYASVAPADGMPVDAIRRGMHRKANFTFMTRYRKHDGLRII